MKKCQKALLTLMPIFFTLALAIPVSAVFAPSYDEAGEDTAIYDSELPHARYDAPDLTVGNRDGEGEEEDPVIEVNKVILHYYNESGDCNGRAFYIWATGVDGQEYSDAYNISPSCVVTYNAPSGATMMTITLDFVNDARFSYLNNRSGLWFIVKFKRISDAQLNWGGQSDDMFLRYEDYPDAVKDKTCEVWAMPAAGGGIAILDMEEKTRVPGIKLAVFEDWKKITCTVTDDTQKFWWRLYAFDETYYRIATRERAAKKKNYLVAQGDNVTPTAAKTFVINFKYEVHPNVVYSLESHDPTSDSTPGMAELNKITTVSVTKLYDTAKFHKYYEQDNQSVKDLGMTYKAPRPSENFIGSTTFKVWSPMSAGINVLIYDIDTSSEYSDAENADKGKGYNMHYTSGGIWELTIDGDLKGKYYNYQVSNLLGTNVCMDPYATSAGACGVRGLIYDKNGDDVKPTGWDALPVKWDGESEKGLDITSPQDLTIYEVHVQDFTGDESWNGSSKPGTYEAFVESGTKLEGTSLTTGYDHLNELGVKAVQLMPMFDHDNDESKDTLKYNWGYNPLNYNVIEGGYSSNAHDGFARVKEFRNLVLKMSETDAHTRVIMDVVYNHVSSATGSAFHKLMPRYYFRYAARDYDFYYDEWYEGGKKPAGQVWQREGELWDGSGCHNEVATERPMMRKFIVDSLSMWATDYKVKGFRFDLMGLIDYNTMNAIRKALYEIDPDIYIYGEGWTAAGYHGEGTAYYDDGLPAGATKTSTYYTGGAATNFACETWQVYHNTNNWSYGDYCYLGGFNDSFRNAVKGGDTEASDKRHYPTSGLVQETNVDRHDDNGNWYIASWPVAQGMWGVNVDKDGYYPEQTISYVSCHDNWTVRDQLWQTMADGQHASGEEIVRGSVQAHALTFACNSAAFMLGGEEIFRTKELTEADLASPTITKDSYTELYGKNISHNSYNSSLECNSFKWGNKLEFSVGDDTVKNSVYKYTDVFKALIAMHHELNKKHGINLETESDKYAVFMEKDKNNDITWGGKDTSSGWAAQAYTTFVYCSCNNYNANVWVDERAKNGTWTMAFQYGASDDEAYFWESDNILGFNGKNAIRIYYSV